MRLVGEAKYLHRIKQKPRKKTARRIRLAAIKQNQSLQPEDAPLQQSEVSSPGKQKLAIESKDVVDLKYLDLVASLLKRLHADGCERDTAGNRSLHFDQYCMLILLYLFNPTISSLRALDQASTLDKVKKQLGCSRATAASMSEAIGVFDADRLKASDRKTWGRNADDKRLIEVFLKERLGNQIEKAQSDRDSKRLLVENVVQVCVLNTRCIQDGVSIDRNRHSAQRSPTDSH